MRYLNPQRSKSLQDRKGWIEGWEPRIEADEFIPGLGIGAAYLRHNGRPATVKLVRAEFNPPRDFDPSGSFPRFSQGNEPSLNLTEKVNWVVMERMRAANENKAKNNDRNALQTAESKRKGNTQRSRNNSKEISPTIPEGETLQVAGQPCEPKQSTPNGSDILTQQSIPSAPAMPRAAPDGNDGTLPQMELPKSADALEWH